MEATATPRGGFVPRGMLRGAAHRVRVALAAVAAAVLGVAPHVLHHVGPLAGAALFAGIGGTLLFGALGFALAVPMLLKLHRHTGAWRAPAAALGLMVAVFSVSSFVIGPAISGSDETGDKSGTPSQSQPATGDGKDAHGH